MEINLLSIANKMVSDGIQWQEVLALFSFFTACVLCIFIIVSGIVKIIQSFCQCCIQIFTPFVEGLTLKKPAHVPQSTLED
jgi:hypothetical protein